MTDRILCSIKYLYLTPEEKRAPAKARMDRYLSKHREEFREKVKLNLRKKKYCAFHCDVCQKDCSNKWEHIRSKKHIRLAQNCAN